ncbi:putative response regulatory protein [compost metagenome]
MTEMMKAYLADDERYIRTGITQLVPWNELGLTLTGVGADGQSAYEDIVVQQPDIVITDIKMPYIDGIELIRRISAELKHTRFIVLSGHAEFELAAHAMRYGVKHYLLKPCDEREITAILQQLIREIREERADREELAGDATLRTQLMKVRSVEEMQRLVRSRWPELEAENGQKEAEFGPQRLVAQMKLIIEENLGESELSLQWLSQHHLYLHPEYLGKLFRKHTGERFTSYLTARRMERAKELIRSFPDMKMYEVAARVGFGTDQQYFGNVFKKSVRMTPMEYKKQNWTWN